MKTDSTTAQEIRTKKLLSILSLSMWTPIYLSIALVLVLAGVINLAMAGFGSFLGLGELAVGICMLVAFGVWREKVLAFLDSRNK